MRSIFICLCMLALPGPAMAQTGFDGFYVGGKAGLGLLSTHMKLEDAENQERADEWDHGLGATGGLFFGGGKVLKNVLYLGGEADVTYHGLSADPSDQESLDLNWSTGASFRLGAVIAQRHLLYGLLGLRLAFFDYDNDTGFAYEYDNGCCDCNGKDADDCDDDDDGGQWGDEDSPVRAGGSLGLGYEFLITDHLGLRAEAAYAIYAPLRYEYLNGERRYWDETILPGVLDATLGLAYHF